MAQLVYGFSNVQDICRIVLIIPRLPADFGGHRSLLTYNCRMSVEA